MAVFTIFKGRLLVHEDEGGCVNLFQGRILIEEEEVETGWREENGGPMA